MKCMVLFCKTAGKVPGVRYFSLTSSRHDAWMRALGRDPTIEQLTKNNSVCSEHFLDQDKFFENNKCHLKPGAIPLLKLGIRRGMVPVQQDEVKECVSSPVNASAPLMDTSSTDAIEDHLTEVEKAKRDVELIHNYSTSPNKLLAKLRKSREDRAATYKKLKHCKSRIKRLTEQVFILKQEIRRLKRIKLPDKSK